MKVQMLWSNIHSTLLFVVPLLHWVFYSKLKPTQHLKKKSMREISSHVGAECDNIKFQCEAKWNPLLAQTVSRVEVGKKKNVLDDPLKECVVILLCNVNFIILVWQHWQNVPPPPKRQYQSRCVHRCLSWLTIPFKQHNIKFQRGAN